MPSLQVPFMRNWFQDQDIRGWTVSAWYKSHLARPGRGGGLVDNGDCVDPSTFYLHTGNDPSGGSARVVAGIDTSGTPTREKTGAEVVSGNNTTFVSTAWLYQRLQLAVVANAP